MPWRACFKFCVRLYSAYRIEIEPTHQGISLEVVNPEPLPHRDCPSACVCVGLIVGHFHLKMKFP